jgi:hypothetical protein
MEPWVSSPNKSKPTIVILADGIYQSVVTIDIWDIQTTTAVNVDSFLYQLKGDTVNGNLQRYIE